MADIDTVLSKGNDNYRFHGVQGATLDRLIAQSENGAMLLWGTDHNDYVEEDEEYSEYVQGEGYLYATDITGWEVSFNSFCDESGMILVLEKIVSEPQEWFPRASDSRECLIRVEEWKVVGGLRPVCDEDGEMIDQEAFSLEEILAM